MLQNKKPCYYKPRGLNKGSYIRVGDRDEVMTEYEIYSLKSYNDGVREDLRINNRANINDLNADELNNYIKKIKEEKINFSKSSNEKILKLSGVVDVSGDNLYPTIAGTMIFGEYSQAFYPQLFIACTVIPGTELGDVGEMGQRFDDNRRIEGTIEQMLEGTLSFLRKNMKTRVIINPKTGKRSNVPEYPMLALKEAIANALIHRDYSLQTENAYIQVYMYSDRIVIQNPGALYGINKLEKLGTDAIMESRNTNIVRILEEKGTIIENRHSGIPTMRREMRKMNLLDPEFINERGSFKVIFRNTIKDDKQESGQQKSLSGEQKSLSGQQKSSSGQQKYQDMVLKYCNVPRTSKEISVFLGIKSRQYISVNIIKPLINNGLLEYTNKNNVRARNQKYITRRD